MANARRCPPPPLRLPSFSLEIIHFLKSSFSNNFLLFLFHGGLTWTTFLFLFVGSRVMETLPSVRANSVWSLPTPTFSPGRNFIPRCLTMIEPARQYVLGQTLMPSLLPAESRPLFDEPPAFFVAMERMAMEVVVAAVAVPPMIPSAGDRHRSIDDKDEDLFVAVLAVRRRNAAPSRVEGSTSGGTILVVVFFGWNETESKIGTRRSVGARTEFALLYSSGLSLVYPPRQADTLPHGSASAPAGPGCREENPTRRRIQQRKRASKKEEETRSCRDVWTADCCWWTRLLLLLEGGGGLLLLLLLLPIKQAATKGEWRRGWRQKQRDTRKQQPNAAAAASPWSSTTNDERDPSKKNGRRTDRQKSPGAG